MYVCMFGMGWWWGEYMGDITASQSVNYELVYKLLIESRRS